MRFVLAALALAFASPAFATAGLECRPTAGKGPTLRLVIGHAVAPSIVSVRMNDGLAWNSGQERMGSRGLAVVRSWLDEERVWLDLADPDLTRFEGRLRAVFRPRLRGRPALGTFVRNGRTWKVRCVEA